MTFSQFLSILRARRILFIAVLLGVIVPVVVISLLWPKKYVGTASVVVDIKPDPVKKELLNVEVSGQIRYADGHWWS